MEYEKKENALNQIILTGQIIDTLDMESINRKTHEMDFTLITKIEEHLSNIQTDMLSNDEEILYLYTVANYDSVLFRIADQDFDTVKCYSNKLQRYNTFEQGYHKSYFERVDYLRKALALHSEKSKVSTVYMAQVSINLANIYYEMGRVIESIEVLSETNKSISMFPMALGNLAIKHHTLAECCTDENVKRYLLEQALIGLDVIFKSEKNKEYIDEDQEKVFSNWGVYIKGILDQYLGDIKPWDNGYDVNDIYKNWCSKKQLSLNYINVICKQGNVDNLHIPNMGIGYFQEDQKMTYYSWFNTIKQEYNLSRYFLYQEDTITYEGSFHESQGYNLLINTLDYPALGYKTELIKSALKTAYGVLDKIGLFCSHFFKVKAQPSKIDFNKWYKDVEMQIALESPFKALYWLSQDFDMNNGYLKKIRRIRNVIEHRYVRVLEFYDIPISQELDDKEKCEYNIQYEDLRLVAYETLKLTRSAIFYMVNGFNKLYNGTVNTELEQVKVFLPLILDVYDDEWKN